MCCPGVEPDPPEICIVLVWLRLPVRVDQAAVGGPTERGTPAGQTSAVLLSENNDGAPATQIENFNLCFGARRLA